MGDRLLASGFEPEDERSLREVESWRGADLAVLTLSPSAEYLTSTGRDADIDFVLAHVDDIARVAHYNGQQVSLMGAAEFGAVPAALGT